MDVGGVSEDYPMQLRGGEKYEPNRETFTKKCLIGPPSKEEKVWGICASHIINTNETSRVSEGKHAV